MDRFGDMIRADGVLVVEIRDRSREPEDALVGAHAECEDNTIIFRD
jgi:hypothetical protein